MFLNRISVIVVVCLLLVACGKIEKPQKPKNLISKEKMTDILYELYIINAAKGVNKKLMENNGVEPETYILNKFNIDSLQFVKSNNYYAFDTELYKSIVDEVKARLEKDKSNFEEIQKAEGMAAKRKRDSIRNANQLKKSTQLKGKAQIKKPSSFKVQKEKKTLDSLKN